MIALLFRRNLLVGTMALFCTYFASLLVVYLISGWLPLLLDSRGVPARTVPLIVSCFQIGGTIGGIAVGTLMDRFDPRAVLAATYLAGAGATVAVGATDTVLPIVLAAVIGLGGLLVSRSHTGLNALAARFYPVEIRATGLATCTTFGRLGAIVGSLMGGLLISSGVSFAGIFGLLAGITVVASVALVVFRVLDPPTATVRQIG